MHARTHRTTRVNSPHLNHNPSGERLEEERRTAACVGVTTLAIIIAFTLAGLRDVLAGTSHRVREEEVRPGSGSLTSREPLHAPESPQLLAPPRNALPRATLGIGVGGGRPYTAPEATRTRRGLVLACTLVFGVRPHAVFGGRDG